MKRNYVVIPTNEKGERIEWMRTNQPLTRKEKLIVNTMGVTGLSTLVSGLIALNGVIIR